MLAVDVIAATQHLLLHGESPRPNQRRCATEPPWVQERLLI